MLFSGINVDDLDWPWTIEVGVYTDLLRFLAAEDWIATKCLYIDQDNLQTRIGIGCHMFHEH